ncbi:MAG: pepsin/retropepsin-like aspartic protease family protein [Planctomycetota bacterium]
MKIRSIVSSSLLGLSLFLHAGCKMAGGSGKRLKWTPGAVSMRHKGPANSTWAKDIGDAGSSCDDHIAGHPKLTQLCRIKYHPSYSADRWMVVEGTLGNGRKYPVILDTGASVALFVSNKEIVQEKAAPTPIENAGDDTARWGRCRLPELQIGPVTFTDWPCYYREQQTQSRLLKPPMARGETIIAGLPALQTFKYIEFNSLSKEVELSLDKVFEPERSDRWTRYSFRLEEDPGGSAFLFVKIPIAGAETELQLDTGSGKGLAISEDLWETMRENIRYIKLRRARDLYPYIGSMDCKRGVIPELRVGRRTVSDARISIFPNDSPIVDRCSGLLGMQYFEDTIMVLDFERYLMWVKDPPGP